MAEYVICAACGRSIAGRVPKGGDGSALFPRIHNTPYGTPCYGHLSAGTKAPAPSKCPACGYNHPEVCERIGHQYPLKGERQELPK